MALIKALNGKSPVIGKNCFLAENATIIGDVKIDDCSSIWYGAVVRGDVHSIKIGKYSNVQDGAIVHASQKYPTTIGDNVIIAHGAVVHGCSIHNNVMIGINAVVLDDVVIRNDTIIAAGSVVTRGSVLEACSVYAGIPAKKIRSVSKELLDEELGRIAKSYNTVAGWHKEELKE